MLSSYIVSFCFHQDLLHFKVEEFLKECVIAVKFDHPNVLQLIGVSIMKEETVPLMVMPYMQNGDVKSFVQSKRGNTIKVDTFPEVNNYSYLVTIDYFDP